jgi:hypothetical protein
MAEADRYQNLVAKLWADPELGGAVRKLAKEQYPDVTLPEDSLAPILAPLQKQNQALADELKALREDRAADRKAREDAEKERADSDFAKRFDEAAAQYNLTDEGKAKMRERMVETKNYTDPYAAAAFILSQNPPAPPPGPMYGAADLNFAGSSQVDPSYALLHQDPGKYLDSEIRKAWGPNAKEYVAREMGQMYADLAFGR